MITEIWTLRRNQDAMEKSLAAWGVTTARLVRRTQRSDTLELNFDGQAFDGVELFPYGSAVTLKHKGVAYYTGVAVKTPRMARPSAEGVGYSFEGPWWYLDHIVYQQNWKFLNVSGDNLAAVSNLVLAIGNDGSLITTGAQIADAVATAQSAGAVLQLGVTDCALTVPPEAGRDLTCAEVIRRMLRWQPDCVTWFDYSTTPPTLHIRRRTSLDAVAFSVAGSPHTGTDIAARPDLVPPVVALKYQILNHVDGVDQSYIMVDQYPMGVSELQPGAIVMTIDLQGTRSQYVKQYLKTAPITPTSVAWWQERLPWLVDTNISNLTIVDDSTLVTSLDSDGGAEDGAASDPASVAGTGGESPIVLANYVIEGQIPEWLAAPGQLHAQTALAQARINYDVAMGHDNNGHPVIERHANEAVFVKVMSTDLGTAWYRQLSAVYIGDPQPEGLAQNYHEALAQLQYEGSFEITEPECGTTCTSFLGRVLNLTGGRSEWTTMRALIFETTEDLATGKTRLRFGPAHYLSPKDWVDLNRHNRQRQQGDLYNKVNGLVTLGSTPMGGTGKYDHAGVGSKAPPSLDTWVGPAAEDNPGTHKISIRHAQIEDAAAAQVPSNLTGQWRAIQVCLPDGSGGTALKTILVLATEPFDPAG